MDVITTLFAIAIIASALFALVHWWSAHPFPLWWDEANYANQMFEDRDAFAQRGIGGVVRAWLFNDPVRPPAYRVFALPFPPRLLLLRTVATAISLIGFALMVVAARRVVSTSAALLAAAVVFAMPGLLTSAGWFGTEYPLLLAISILMAALIPRISPPGVAIAVALGLLSKTTFVVVAGPPLLAAFLYLRTDRRNMLRLAGGAFAGAAIASGWWLWHLGPALAYAQYGRSFQRASLGAALALETLVEKIRIFTFDALGIGVAAALTLLFVTTRRATTPEQRRAVVLACAASVPLIVLAFASNVFVPRHFAPALIPLVIVVAVTLEHARPVVRVVVAMAVLAQIAFVPLPRVEQTDWSRLRAIIPESNLRIAFLGGWPSLSPPEIRYAWRRGGDDAEVAWLWRFEDGPIDWSRVMKTVTESDVVLVVSPDARMPVDARLEVDENIDNRHNAEFIARLERSGVVRGPERFVIGTRHRVELLLYRPKTRPSAQQ
jgi:hypothetical protein